ncbi:hypothetical protein RFI_40212 [Reticulomyxa filosa]|uniref:Uncharacterized protein n=1 Tax=Reticulomyxa filosa TaxID=46433 RepID=X6L9B8_RETFI|nr:hypothetical protein RFI_40212 [Reticulomyxa filosa]|eukprot:ETN97319.1 hypothetical protein RFI_40212 [Reticulomyxa filosa]
MKKKNICIFLFLFVFMFFKKKKKKKNNGKKQRGRTRVKSKTKQNKTNKITRADRAKSLEMLIQDERVDLYLVDKTGKNIWDLAGPVAKMVLDIMLPVILFLSKNYYLSPLSLLFFHLYVFTKKKKKKKKGSI